MYTSEPVPAADVSPVEESLKAPIRHKVVPHSEVVKNEQKNSLREQLLAISKQLEKKETVSTPPKPPVHPQPDTRAQAEVPKEELQKIFQS
jgi:hypothetical protein